MRSSISTIDCFPGPLCVAWKRKRCATPCCSFQENWSRRRSDQQRKWSAVKTFAELREKWLARMPATESPSAPSDKAPPGAEASVSPDERIARKSLTNLCHALMNSAEFIYVD